MLSLIGSVFMAYGFYAIWMGILNNYWFHIIFGLVPVAGGLGLILRKKWSKSFVYFAAIGASGLWLYATSYQISIGSFPYPSFLKSLLSLLPGICILVFCGGSCFIVSRKLGAEK